MGRVTFNTLDKAKAGQKRRRTSVSTRAKYAKKTVGANRQLIQANASDLRMLRKMLPPPVWTDYQLSGTLFASVPDPGSFSETIAVRPLMDPQSWRECLRRDLNAIESSTTEVLRMQMNLRYSLQLSNWAQFTTFIVTIRPDAASRTIDANGLNINDDYINSAGQDFNVRLNPAVFKVHYVRNVSLTKNTWPDAAITIDGTQAAFNPETTMAKGQVNVQMNHRIRQPIQGTPWKEMAIANFSPGERYYLLTFITQQSETTVAARLDYDALFTCKNAS